MSAITSFLPYIQIVLSILMIGLILLQQSSTGTGGAFGEGSNWSSAYHTRRGAEKYLFFGTIVTAILFALAAFANIVW